MSEHSIAVRLLIGGLSLLTSCAQQAAASRTTEAELGNVRVLDAASSLADAQPVFVDLGRDGLAGGQLTYVLSGSSEAVHAMFLDFDRASGRRPWAQKYRVLERNESRVLARWDFRGKLGVHPRVEIEFLTEKRGDSFHVVYRIVDGDFGLTTFEGTILLRPHSSPTLGERTLVTQSVFIDSGLPFINASAADIEAGLRADAEHLQAWSLERTGRGAGPR